MKKNTINQKGFTLVEVILGMAIMGIVAMSILPIITHGFVQINRSGNKTEALYLTQQSIEKNLDGESDGTSTITDKTITVEFDKTKVDIEGKIIQVEKEYDRLGNKTMIKSFKPN